MAEQGETLCGGPEEKSPGVTLSDSLVIARRRSTRQLPTSTIRLDRENISSIGKLQSLGDIHSLYLQQNQIEKIENLDSFPNLRFLCLAGNRIQRVENLQPLPHLSVLDLSHNQIQVLDTEELPRSLLILDLKGNGCTRQERYRDLVLAALPHLLLLDSLPIHRNTAEEKAGGGSSSSEEDYEELFPELRTPFTVDKGARTGQDTWHRAGSATSPVIPVPPCIPGRFLVGCAVGAGQALSVEAQGEPGGAPGQAGGAAGAPAPPAGHGVGQSRRDIPLVPALSPGEAEDTAGTSASVQQVSGCAGISWARGGTEPP